MAPKRQVKLRSREPSGENLQSPLLGCKTKQKQKELPKQQEIPKQKELPKQFQSGQFSFMKETTSSKTKALCQQLAPRALSHSEVYNKRHLPPNFASKKRQLSYKSKPVDVTNQFDPVSVPFGHKPTMFSSPSRTVSQGYSAKNKEDVYTRLYKSAAKQQAMELRSAPTYPRSLQPAKPRTDLDMFRIIHAAEPGLFEDSTLLHLGPNTPFSPQQLLDSPEGQLLSVYERGEVMRKKNLYYVPRKWDGGRPINISSFKNNFGFDDPDGNYVIVQGDHIEYRYEIQKVLGTGSFGNVVLCTDHKYSNQKGQRKVAIKIIRNELDWSLQAVSEIKMLKQLSSNNNIMDYYDHLHFRGHMCIVTEVLSLNLFTFLELEAFRGVALPLLKSFAFQILSGLKYIHDKKIIHCDIKPENIMIKLPASFDPESGESFAVKIIDFGSSCVDTETSFSYIQSRFYRAPEVILGAKYGFPIDIWSFGCVIAEMFTGSPLLPGKTEIEQIGLILELFGPPSSLQIIQERKKLMNSKKAGTRLLNDPLVSDPSVHKNIAVDERRIKKTLLYSLFNLEGKINLQFLNLQLQASTSQAGHSAPSPFRKNFRLSSRSLDVALRLHNCNERPQDVQAFAKFMSRIFLWDPRERADSEELLQSAFLAAECRG